MSTHAPIQFQLKEGLDAYNPDVVQDTLNFLTLNNVDPRLGRLFASKGYSLFQDLTLAAGDKIVSFGYYQLTTRQYNNFYAFSRTKAFWFDFATGQFDATPIYSGFLASDDPYVLLPWYDCLYVTKLGSPAVKFQRKTATALTTLISARYGIIANSHAYLVGMGDGTSFQLARIRWSDLDNPEDLEIRPANSEADFFDLEPDSRQATGVSYQRGSPVVFAENMIWLGTPIGFPGGFRHEPLYSGVGNIFHNALVRNGDVDYFIGEDNIYRLNGLQLEPVGDPIFTRFIGSVKLTPTPAVRGYLDTRKDQVFWVYTKSDDSQWSIVYNYKENKWSERDPQGLAGWFNSPRVALRGYDAIDDVAAMIEDVAVMIDDPAGGYPIVLPQLGGSPAIIVQANDAALKADGTSFAHIIETFDFYFETVGEMNEVTKALLEYVGVGTPNLQISVGSRDNQSATIAWSTAKTVDTTKGSLAFFIRAEGVGKYLRFKFTWGNTADNYITDLRLLSLIKVEAKEDVPAEK